MMSFGALFVILVALGPFFGAAPAPSLAVTHVAAIAASTNIPMFTTEAAAQAHCPRDVVVWLNTRTGIWHEKGMRWYGRTKYGAYVCRKEAAAAGYRDTENGQ